MLQTQIAGYEIEDTLGRGNSATVYRALFSTHQEPVALKVLDAHLTGDTEAVDSFRQDLRSAARLVHPNILRTYAAGGTGSACYVATELVEGETLQAILQRGPIPVERVCELVRQVAAALDYAHSQGVIHQDLKPSNLFVREDGRVLISDFGLAWAARLAAVTSSTAVRNRAPYLSPEQCQGRPVDHRADLFALGVILFECLTGRRPFGDDPASLYFQPGAARPPALDAFLPEGGRALQKVVERALAIDPRKRFQSAGDLAEALESAAGVRRTTGEAKPGAALLPFRGAAAPLPAKLKGAVSHSVRRVDPRNILKGVLIVGAVAGAVLGGMAGGQHVINRLQDPEDLKAPVRSSALAATTAPGKVDPLTRPQLIARLRVRFRAYVKQFERYDRERARLAKVARERRLAALGRELDAMVAQYREYEMNDDAFRSQLYREMGTLEWYRSNAGAARRHWQRAVALDPGNFLAEDWLRETDGGVLAQ